MQASTPVKDVVVVGDARLNVASIAIPMSMKQRIVPCPTMPRSRRRIARNSVLNGRHVARAVEAVVAVDPLTIKRRVAATVGPVEDVVAEVALVDAAVEVVVVVVLVRVLICGALQLLGRTTGAPLFDRVCPLPTCGTSRPNVGTL